MNKNNIDFSEMSNGNVNTRYNSNRKDYEVEPMKLADPKGVAKASPRFQEVEKEEEELDEEAKAKAIAKNSEKVDDR